MKEFFIGQTASISKAFSAKDVETFSSLSLDTNEVHLDEEYAKTTLFRRRIVHGFLSGSLISAIIGTILPGRGAIYLHQEMDFVKPVYINDLITATVVVKDFRQDKRILLLETQCVNSRGEVVIKGNAVVKAQE